MNAFVSGQAADRAARGDGLANRRRVGAPRASASMTRRVLIQALLATAVPAALLASGAVGLGARLFWVTLVLLLVRLAGQGRRDELLCVLIAVAPFANLLRGELFFHVVTLLFGGGVIFWFASTRGSYRAFSRVNPLVPWLAAYFAAYYLLTLVTTREYDVNLRVTECLFGAIIMLILGRRRETLAAALCGLTVSVCLLGVALLPHLADNDRLGIIEFEGTRLGNPIQFGLPVALCLLAVISDGGRWMGFSSRAVLRLTVAVILLALLFLTTSRTSWLVAAVGAACQFAFGKRSRPLILLAGLAGVVVLRLLLLSSAGEGVKAGLDRTFSDERSARNRTSGRSDQWIVAYHAVTRSAGTLFFGYGAGSGARVYARESLAVSEVQFHVGSEIALHSLYMQLAVELGLVGFLPFVVWTGLAGRRIAIWTRRNRLVLPLTAFLGYLLAATAASGNDVTSGALLGIGLLAAVQVSAKRKAPIFDSRRWAPAPSA